MKAVVRLSLVAAVVLAAGCSKSICDRGAEMSDTLTAKLDKCPDLKASVSTTKPTEAEIKECEDRAEKCTAQDEEKLNAAYDCLEDVADCEAGKESEFAEAFAACFKKAETISDACSG